MVENIRSLVEQDPLDVVRHLKQSDMEYWEAVKNEILYPFLDENTTYGRRIRDKNVDRDEVYSFIYEKMVIQNKLEVLRAKKYILSYIIEYVKSYVRSLFERKRKDASICVRRRSCKPTFVELDSAAASGREFEYYLLSQQDDEQKTDTQCIRTSFNKLWDDNPRRALVMLLRFVNGLTTREVKEFMDLASENYVNQVVKLAKGDMQKTFLDVSALLNREE